MGNCWPWQDFQRGPSEELGTSSEDLTIGAKKPEDSSDSTALNVVETVPSGELGTSSEDTRRTGAEKPEDSSDSPTLNGPETGSNEELATNQFEDLSGKVDDDEKFQAEDSPDSPILNVVETGCIDWSRVNSLEDVFNQYQGMQGKDEEHKSFEQLQEVVGRLRLQFLEKEQLKRTESLKKELENEQILTKLEAKYTLPPMVIQGLSGIGPWRSIMEDYERESRLASPILFVEDCCKDQVEKIKWGKLPPKIVYHRRHACGGAVLLIADTFTLLVDTTEAGWQKSLIDTVHTILRTIHILILGEPFGLEEDLAYDFALVAKQAGVDTSKFPVSKETEQSEITDRGMFVLLSCPTVEQLNRSLRKYLKNSPATNISIYYSGHSDSNGDWWLGDDNFYGGRDIKQLMSEVQQYIEIESNVTIVLLINSCYGLKFVEDALVKNDDIRQILEKFNSSIQSGLEVLKQIGHDDDDPILKNINIAELCNIYISLVTGSEDVMQSQCVSDEINEANSDMFTKLMIEMYRSPNPYFKKNPIGFLAIHSKLSEGNYLSFRLVPFCLESLDARGVLFTKGFDVSPSDDKAKENMLRKRAKPNLKRNLTSPLAPAVQPTIYAFPAGFGDSTLIRYDGINILIDGGIYKAQPCFWPVVSRLPADEKLDVVILTHQDADHLEGIRALIKRAPDDFIGALYCLDPPPPGTVPNSAARFGGTEVWNKAVERKVAKKLQPCCIPFNDRADIKLCILAPNESDARKAQKCMTLEKKSRAKSDLSAPNRASAVVYLGITKGDRTYRALFTGDAHSSTVVDAIKNAEQLSEPEVLDLSFDYIDVPHHGSKTNDPNDLFKSVKKCDVAVISTNGDRYGHPDKSTLTDLGNHMRTGKIGKVGFTYKKHQGKNICEPSVQGNGMLRYEGLGDLQGNRVYAADNAFVEKQNKSSANNAKERKSCLKIVLNREGSSITSKVMSTTD